jgi:hypothetical protein
MHDRNVKLYLMVVYTCFKAGQLFLSRGAVNSIMIRLRAERHGVRIPGGPKTIPFSKTFRPALGSTDPPNQWAHPFLSGGKASQV